MTFIDIKPTLPKTRMRKICTRARTISMQCGGKMDIGWSGIQSKKYSYSFYLRQKRRSMPRRNQLRMDVL